MKSKNTRGLLEDLFQYCYNKHLEHGLEAYHGSEFDEGGDQAYLDIMEIIKKLKEDPNAIQRMKNREKAQEIMNVLGNAMGVKFEVKK